MHGTRASDASNASSITMTPMSGYTSSGAPKNAQKRTLGFADDEENISPAAVPSQESALHLYHRDLHRGNIMHGILKRRLFQLRQALDMLRQAQRKSYHTPLENLSKEVDTLQRKVASELEMSEMLSVDLSNMKAKYSDEKGSVQSEINKLGQFCDHFRSVKFMSAYQEEEALRQLELERTKTQELTAFLEARIAVERQKKKAYSEAITSFEQTSC